MKVQTQRQWICYLLVAILFLTGMCVELPHADVSFLRANEVSATGMTSSAISDGVRITSIETMCTLETLHNGTTTYLSNSKTRTSIRRFIRDAVALVTVVILLSDLFYARDGESAISQGGESRHDTIIRYIQQTDGKK